MKIKLLLFAVLALSLSAIAQPGEKFVRVIVKPNSSDWNYKLGDKVQFDVLVTKNSIPLTDVKVRYELS
ncbi:MAG: acetylxylan esterase, partial [Dysgonomonas sp.]